MTNPYPALFLAPGSKAFTCAGLIARLPLPMLGIGIITLLSQLHGRYTLAGAVAASFVLAYAVLSPQVSRLVDRHGQHRVLPAAAVLSSLGMALLVLASRSPGAEAWLFVGAVLAGTMPSVSAMIRARWTALYQGQPRLQTAYSLETVLDELSFIAGPPLAVGLSVAWFPQAGVVLAGLLLIAGVLALALQRGSEPRVQPRDASLPVAAPVGLNRTVRLLALMMVAMGLIVGALDITSVAFARLQGHPAAASLVLAAYALGSCVAGLVFGARPPRLPLPTLLLAGAACTAIASWPLLLASNVLGLSAAVLVAGLFFAPTMIVAMTLVESVLPAARLTEGMTWLLAGLNVGVAIGAALAGVGVDAAGPTAGFMVPVAAGALVVVFAGLASRSLPGQDSTTCVEASP